MEVLERGAYPKGSSRLFFDISMLRAEYRDMVLSGLS